MYQVQEWVNVPGTGVEECTRYKREGLYQVQKWRNVPGTKSMVQKATPHPLTAIEFTLLLK
ncbi:hypothetical protein QTG56_03430 [Rossellomorea sp. AcN35-11]|nr:hypothetical protein [Rossellomorea aquimaris]WJV30206.1 hypothetical protein QTG56_03430 [Rossellomorea sp. AcN35-11]